MVWPILREGILQLVSQKYELRPRFCSNCPQGLWRSKEDAVNGGRGPWHKQARAAIAQMYEMIDVHGLRLTIEDDVEDWSFGPYH